MANCNNHRRGGSDAGMTLLELIVSCAILMVLASAALPVARYTIIRQKETELRNDLVRMREAIDYYKYLADHGQIRADISTGGYPPDLETLVKGVSLVGIGAGSGSIGGSMGGSGSSTKKIRFLRSIPVDPMTGKADWGLRSVEDDLDSTTWGGKDVFDVYSKSTGIAMDGTKYSDW
ncbi:MAG TPA: type II secretion system protein [Candidatus Limnocylindrales bacterium]|nr:type II secretion system protein [Candidatus Limnocylindrales bacterium]